MSISYDERVRGCLTGAVLGAKIAFAHYLHPEKSAVSRPEDILTLALDPQYTEPHLPHSQYMHHLLPLLQFGVNVYLTKRGRVTPEDFAALFKDDPGIATQAWCFDLLHSTQEVLKEGMHPRLSGFGAAQCGLIGAAMPAVGIYHAGDPDYAYLDGVELASVTQNRLGADWAALCAAAIAAALTVDATEERVVSATLAVAGEYAPDLLPLLQSLCATARQMAQESPEALARWWTDNAGVGREAAEGGWVEYHPIRFVLPLLPLCGQDVRLLLAHVITPPPASWYESRAVSALIAGAILGALHGPDVFPQEWRAIAEAEVAPLLPIIGVAQERRKREREIVTVIDRLAEPDATGVSALEDRIYGCLLASSIGNAMGSVVEGKLYPEIDAKFPGGVLTVLQPSRLEKEDDNQMAMLLVDTYLERAGRPVVARHFGKTWEKRLDRKHFFSLCMGHAYDLICQGWDPRITGHWKIVTGSTVMCMEPVGIFHLADPEFAYIDGTTISYMYQRGLDVTAAAVLAATVAQALRPDASVNSVLQAALDATPRTKQISFDQRSYETPYDYICSCLEVAEKYDDVLAVRAELYEKCLLYSHVDPLELWGLALAMFKVANGDVRLSAIGGTNIGRDSDTIAGRAAMLAGALRGSQNVPADWLALFAPAILEHIRTKARQFAALLTGPKREHLRQRIASVATDSGGATL